MILVSVLPQDVHAVSSGKTAKKYTITISNANSNTVIKKGGKLKLQSTAVAKDGSRAKVKYKSSNRKVITVTKKGVLKGKKKGKAKITAYVKTKGRIRSKKTITIRVGKPVSSISLSGYIYLREGKTSKITAKVSSAKATNKKVKWKSSNPNVASVDSNGIVTGRGNGAATITATAKDGSGKTKSITVYSHKYTKDDTNWIAHRGLHTKEKENTAAAFEAAGEADFWGCECDIYETKEDEEGNFDIVIDHDGNFKRVFGVNARPNALTTEEIRNNSKLSEVCFFDEYIDICNEYNMVPIVEIKDLSQSGIEKMSDIVYDSGLMSETQFISFDSSLLEKTKQYVSDEYGIDPYVGYLLDGSRISSGIDKAKQLGFNGVNLQYSGLTEEINRKCKTYDLRVCTWTYTDSAYSNDWLYKHVVTGKYDVDSITTDGKFF